MNVNRARSLAMATLVGLGLAGAGEDPMVPVGGAGRDEGGRATRYRRARRKKNRAARAARAKTRERDPRWRRAR